MLFGQAERRNALMFILCGDTHATFDLPKVTKYFYEHRGEFSEDDYLIILGDVQVCGFDRESEKETRETLCNLPVTVLFIDGNHENFDKLNSYPMTIWNGGKVHIIEKNIKHLMRGQVFDIDGTTFFTFGGAASIDRNIRSEGIDWFKEEIPNEEEYAEGLANLKKHGKRVDYILSHTAPYEVAACMGYGEKTDSEIELRKYLQSIADSVDFTSWYFGHFHEDTEIEGVFFCLYDEIVEVD